jgi:transporter family-2 protein
MQGILLDRGMGTKESLLITCGGGGIAAALLVLLLPGSNLKYWSYVPWFAFSARLFGLIRISRKPDY